jgi:protein-tyrosine phosphatase
MKPKQRKTNHLSTSDELYKHSPLKKGLKVKDEDEPLENYTKIMSRLYLGNNIAAKDLEFFNKKKIKAVLNCSKDIPNTFSSKKHDIEYMRIPIDDSLKEVDIEKCFKFMPSIVEFIHKHVVLQKHNIFVHCWAGRQRSAISIAAYLIAKHDMDPKKACKFILKHRKEAFHFGESLNFEKSLDKYYKQLQKTKQN